MYKLKNVFPNGTPVATVRQAILDDGYAVVLNVLDGKTLAKLRKQIQPHLDKTNPDAINPFNGQCTKRFGRVAWRVPAAREVIAHQLTKDVLDGILLKVAKRHKLTFSGVMHVMAGQKAQVGHRDNVHMRSSHPLMIATMWAVEDFRRENGATVFVPGSHKWPNSRKPTREEIAVAEMPAGSVLFYDANVIHGAGKCTEGTRTGLSLQYCVAWLQQEENQALAIPFRVLRKMGEGLLKVLGFDIIARNCGEIDSGHPIDAILKDGKKRDLAPPGSEYTDGVTLTLELAIHPPCKGDDFYDISLDEAP